MTAEPNKKNVPWYLWPIWLPLKLAFFLIALCGRFVGFIFGIVMILVGKLLTATVIGAILGVPLFILGLTLAACCLFKW